MKYDDGDVSWMSEFLDLINKTSWMTFGNNTPGIGKLSIDLTTSDIINLY